MMKNTQTELFFDNISGKHVVADFSGGVVTSDAGALFLRSAEKRCGVIDSLYRSLRDRRHGSYVDHSLRTLITQRVMQIACGHEDANDCNELRFDPGIKAACGKLPLDGDPLSSQPTMSRLENAVNRAGLYRMGLGLVHTFIRSYPKPPRRIILDIDDTDDEVHGGQQLALFNSFVGGYCFQPIHLYEGTSGKLIAALLRPGKRPCGEKIASLLRHVVKHLRRFWPKTTIIIRGDSHYSAPEVHDYCEENGLFYIFGQTPNSRIKELASQGVAQRMHGALSEPVVLFDDVQYQAKSWKRKRRVIVKTAATDLGVDVRAIVTNLPWKNAQRLYRRLYCDRGRMENFIKNHKNVLRSDKTSCHRFEANQFRLLLHSAAYVLLQTLQEIGLKGTEYAKAQFDTIRLRFMKIGARVIESSRQIRFCLPTSYPLKEILAVLSRNLAIGFR
jgi:hypothetical protein